MSQAYRLVRTCTADDRRGVWKVGERGHATETVASEQNERTLPSESDQTFQRFMIEAVIMLLNGSDSSPTHLFL